MNRIKQHRYLLGILLLLAMYSCSTQKNTIVTRSYHNLVSHYNIYFNGKEAMKLGLVKVDQTVPNDYTKILPVYKESVEEAGKIVQGDMDVAVEKGSKVIKQHSITKPPKSKRSRSRSSSKKTKPADYNKWVDNSYMLMGKAFYYQHDYSKAISTFSYILRVFSNDPVKYEAYLWLARSYSESERYNESLEILEKLQGDDKFPKKLEGELAIVQADLNLKQRYYNEAIHDLDLGIKNIKGNKQKTRYSYILAQLYQETGNKEKALEQYRNVIRRHPDYEMLFNARINSANVFSGEGNGNDLRKDLNKMLRNKRNTQFHDQIYYALGNISNKEGKVDEAVELYRKSAYLATENKYQRALSCITVAEIYFDQKKYIPSQNYYDSAMVVIEKDYPNYSEIAKRYTSLSNLVGNLQMVITQDSLQKLASMSEVERNQLINNWMAAEKKKIEEAKLKDAEGQYSGGSNRYNQYRMELGNTGAKAWYFYNPSTVSFGKKEFKRLWGNRKDEDNWRRINKNVSTVAESPEELAKAKESVAAEPEEKKRNEDPTTREFYTQDLPINDSLMAVSHNNIRDALYNAGTIFRSDFSDNDRSKECFIELNRRYPENLYTVSSYYNLYDLYKIANDADSAKFYSELIISKYPESNFAKYIQNPNFFVEQAKKNETLNKTYASAFEAYKNRNFTEAAQLSRQAMSMNPDSSMLSKAKFILMISSSRGFDRAVFADSLKNYINKFPKAEPTPLAKSILELIGDNKLTNYQELVSSGYLNEIIKNLELKPVSETNKDPFGGKWDYDAGLLHYFVIALPATDSIDINRLKFDVASYNIDHYSSLDFDIETENLNSETKLLVVRSIENKESALVYFMSIINKAEVFKTLAGRKYFSFVISNNNYRQLVDDKSYIDYLKFYVQNYSRFTTGTSPNIDVSSPEKAMADLKKAEEEVLTEKGKYVVVQPKVVETKKEEAIESKPQSIFDTNWATPHSFVILVSDPAFDVSDLMQSINVMNGVSYRNLNLRTTRETIKNEAQLTVVGKFTSAGDAYSYLNSVVQNRDLYSSIGDRSYRNFVISEVNLKKLLQPAMVSQYVEFYKENYIDKKTMLVTPTTTSNKTETVPTPVKTVENKPTLEKTATQPIAQPEVIAPKPNVVEAKKDTVSAVKPGMQPSATATAKLDSIKSATAKLDSIKSATTKLDSIKSAKQAAIKSYNGSYKFDSTASNSMVFIFPTEGFNKATFIAAIAKLNESKFKDDKLKIFDLPLDNFRTLIIIGDLKQLRRAFEYEAALGSDPTLMVMLKNVTYRNALMTNENLQYFKLHPNFTEYSTFYKLFYQQ